MRLLLSLLGILGIVYGVAWFAYDMHPRGLTGRIWGEIKSVTSAASRGAGDMADSSARFSEVIQNRYHSQDMTEPHPN